MGLLRFSMRVVAVVTALVLFLLGDFLFGTGALAYLILGSIFLLSASAAFYFGILLNRSACEKNI